jgi:hypothetical protein
LQKILWKKLYLGPISLSRKSPKKTIINRQQIAKNIIFKLPKISQLPTIRKRCLKIFYFHILNITKFG